MFELKLNRMPGDMSKLVCWHSGDNDSMVLTTEVVQYRYSLVGVVH